MVQPVRMTPGEEYQNSVIGTLEEALRRARAGKIKAIALSYVKTEGGTANAWSKVREPAALLGAITLTGIDLGNDMLRDSTITTLEDASKQDVEPFDHTWVEPDNVA